MSGRGPSSKRARPQSQSDSDGESSSDKSRIRKTRFKKPKVNRDAKAGGMKFVQETLNPFRPYTHIFNRRKPSEQEIKEEMERIKKVSKEVVEEKDKIVSKEWKKITKNVEVLKIDDKNVTPFVFTGAKRIHSKPPPRKYTTEIVKTLFFEPLNYIVDAKNEPQLGHTPLIDLRQDSNSISHHFHEKYEGGVHGYRFNDFDISEEMLYMIMKKVLPGTEKADLLYYALYKTFNNSGSQKEFAKMFPTLHRVYGDGSDVGHLEHWKDMIWGKPNKEEPTIGPSNYKSLGQWKKVYVRASGIAGNGLFLGEDVKRKDFIGEYIGERCSKKETDRRSELGQLTISYVFEFPSGESIDSDRAGNVFRFMNDSKRPNCRVEREMGSEGMKQRMKIIALKNIAAGTELTLAYKYPKHHADVMFRSRPGDRVPKMGKPSGSN